jgi:hypothetical protein
VAIAFVISCIGQLLPLIQKSLAEPKTSWNHAPGWQWEISAWNLFGAIVLIELIRLDSLDALAVGALGTTLLCLCLFLNHTISCVKEEVGPWHAVLAGLNLCGVVFGVTTLALNWSHIPF